MEKDGTLGPVEKLLGFQGTRLWSYSCCLEVKQVYFSLDGLVGSSGL